MHHLDRKPTTLREHTDLIWQTLFVDNGNTLISFSDDKTILKSNLRLKQTDSFPISAKEWNWGAAINPQESILALAGDSPVIDLYDLATRKKIDSLEGFQNRVKAIAFRQSGDLVSVSENGLIKIWNLESGECDEIQGNSQGEYGAWR